MDRELVVALGLPVAFIVLLLAGAFWMDAKGCHSKWEHSGFQTSWGPIQGCLISRDGKTYIPEDNYREFGDK